MKWLMLLSLCQQYSGDWVYTGRESDGFETLKLSMACDSQAPLPSEFLDWAKGKELALHGYLSFNADGYNMGPFPFASVAAQQRLKTHYFYTYSGEDGYQFEDFDLEMKDGAVLLHDMEECDTGLCEAEYLFKRVPSNL